MDAKGVDPKAMAISYNTLERRYVVHADMLCSIRLYKPVDEPVHG